MYFERLTVWKRSAKLSADLYIYLRELKDYGFKDQITRSGLSVPSNIAEGMSRESEQEKRRYLNIAYSSCAELRTQVYIGAKIGYIDRDTCDTWIDETKEISAMLRSLAKNLPQI